TNYDVFIYSNAGTPTIDTFVAWTNDTTRATALTLQDGVYVKNGAATRRYLGTFRTTSTTTTEDSLNKRLVWNVSNQVERRLFMADLVNTHTYNGAVERAWNNDASFRLKVVVGIDEFVNTGISGFVAAGAETAVSYISLGYDSSTTDLTLSHYVANYNTSWVSGGSTGGKVFSAGYHYIQAVENGSGSPASNFASTNITATVDN
ncbi:MAG: hypothetical protein AAB647_03075, partial [Patescibacteria group bacterium]